MNIEGPISGDHSKESIDYSSGSSSNIFGEGHPAREKKAFLDPRVTRKKKKSGVSVGSKHSQSSSQSDYSNCSSKEKDIDIADESGQLQNELKGQVVELAKQQHGSKQLQKVLARASPDFVGFAIEETLLHLHELMVDQYGNYFCQKLMQSASSA